MYYFLYSVRINAGRKIFICLLSILSWDYVRIFVTLIMTLGSYGHIVTLLLSATRLTHGGGDFVRALSSLATLIGTLKIPFHLWLNQIMKSPFNHSLDHILLFLFKTVKYTTVLDIIGPERSSLDLIDGTVLTGLVIYIVRFIYFSLLSLRLSKFLLKFLSLGIRFFSLIFWLVFFSFLFPDCLVVASDTSSFSIYLMTLVMNLSKDMELILTMLLRHWVDIIWFMILIRSPSVNWVLGSSSGKYSK